MSNMTPADIIALGKIKAMKDFVVKPADKGGKIFVWPIDQGGSELMKEAE